MKESIKNKIILTLALLAIIFFISLISSYQDTAKQKRLVNQERRVRMGLEEKALDLSNRNAQLEQRLSRLQEAIGQQKADCQVAQEELNQEIVKLKQELEKEIK